MPIVTMPLFGNPDPEPDPARQGLCDTCGQLTGDPDDNFCDNCWDMNQPEPDHGPLTWERT